MKNILVLGAGMVARPLIRYLLDQNDFFIIVADRLQERAEALVRGHHLGRALTLDVNDEKRVASLISEADLVISLLPHVFHVQVAKLCLQHRVHLITPSYVTPAMQALDQPAREKGVLLLNELGLDPGIDHMSAMSIIHNVEQKGGRIISLESCCGGMPAPESNDNPFGYKFSWNPRGVVTASLAPARYLQEGAVIKVSGHEIFHHCRRKRVQGLGDLEVYPNRDALVYRDRYGLEYVRTLLRGTFRNPGWCETLEKIVQLGLIDDAERPELADQRFSEVIRRLIGASRNEDLTTALSKYLGIDKDSAIMKRLEWLGLLSDDRVEASAATLLDILTARMVEKMAYKEGERDMIVLQHDFIAEYSDERKEHICSLLVDYGIPHGDSSMARTVSLPVAIAAKLIVRRKVDLVGVLIPVEPELYVPVLKELEEMGIQFREHVTRL